MVEWVSLWRVATSGMAPLKLSLVIGNLGKWSFTIQIELCCSDTYYISFRFIDRYLDIVPNQKGTYRSNWSIQFVQYLLDQILTRFIPWIGWKAYRSNCWTFFPQVQILSMTWIVDANTGLCFPRGLKGRTVPIDQFQFANICRIRYSHELIELDERRTVPIAELFSRLTLTCGFESEIRTDRGLCFPKGRAVPIFRSSVSRGWIRSTVR